MASDKASKKKKKKNLVLNCLIGGRSHIVAEINIMVAYKNGIEAN